MNCPTDGTVLQITERQGVEIDYCPQCRGVWLDRGELDKIIDRFGQNERRPSRDVDERERRGGKPPKKRKSLLSELFEFGE